MTHFLQRSALIFLASTALSATPALARPPHHGAHHGVHHGKRRPAAEADQAERASYTVKKGDTLATIADKLDTTIEDLRTTNHLRKRAVLRPGQVLKGPVVLKAAGSKGGGKTSGKAAAASSYTVVHGDTLFAISQKLHLSVDELRRANGLSARAQIHAGQELKLPGGEEAVDEAPAKGKGSAKSRRGRKGAAAEEPSEATGHVTTVQARGEVYKARKGDTLAKIADRLDTDVGQLKRLNHIRGNTVRAGQIYRGPSFAEHVYTAVAGDTLASIAERFGVSVARLRAENELSKRAFSVRPGQKVYLPDGYRDTGGGEERPSRTYPRPVEPTGQLPSRPQPYQPSGQTPRPYVPPSSPSSPAPTFSDTQITQMGKGRFQWPLRGEILSEFGPKTGGQNNAGVNIQANAGAPVHAAADGEVVYAGDQVPGFGNLVLIKHADGWSTAYAYLSHIDVKMQQKVTQGQQIGQAGSTGGVPEPQLHFEVRYAPNPTDRAAPVNPKLVLPN